MMLGPNARNLTITLANGDPHDGLYETDGRRLARRVELPLWLSNVAQHRRADPALIAARQDRSIHGFLRSAKPDELTHTSPDSKGHILLHPGLAGVSASEPLVGIDQQIYLHLPAGADVFLFFVYRSDYQLHETWSISLGNFRATCLYVQTSESFMPQVMIPISTTKRVGN